MVWGMEVCVVRGKADTLILLPDSLTCQGRSRGCWEAVCKADSGRRGLAAKWGPGVLPWDVSTGWRNGFGQSLSAQVGSVSFLGLR